MYDVTTRVTPTMASLTIIPVEIITMQVTILQAIPISNLLLCH
jgi:hypothetical protein